MPVVGRASGRASGSRGQGARRVVGLDPAAVLLDGDRLDLVAVGIGGGEDVAGGDQRDLVLGRLAAEQHDEPDSFGVVRGHAPTVVRRACMIGVPGWPEYRFGREVPGI